MSAVGSPRARQEGFLYWFPPDCPRAVPVGVPVVGHAAVVVVSDVVAVAE